jgi:hypothetical protein
MSRIAEIEGIGPVYAQKLKSIGVGTTTDLLELCGSKKGRQDTAEKRVSPRSLYLNG